MLVLGIFCVRTKWIIPSIDLINKNYLEKRYFIGEVALTRILTIIIPMTKSIVIKNPLNVSLSNTTSL